MYLKESLHGTYMKDSLQPISPVPPGPNHALVFEMVWAKDWSIAFLINSMPAFGLNEWDSLNMSLKLEWVFHWSQKLVRTKF